MTARMSRDSARHITAEQVSNGVTHQGITALCLNRAYDALGYANWADYVKAELRDAVDRLGKDEKSTLAVSLRESGCSLRAVSSVVGWSHTTVKNRTGAKSAVTAFGADGLTYNQPRSRKSYPSAVLDAAWDLRSASERLTALTHDPRFDDVRDAIADQLHSHLVAAWKTLLELEPGKAHIS